MSCPNTVKKFNKNIQDVYKFNDFMSLFSLNEINVFTKYYKKIAMEPLDFILVNA